MLKRYGENTEIDSAARVDELFAQTRRVPVMWVV